MIDIAKEREFIQEVDRKTRELELKKAKLEQNKVMTEEQLKQVNEKMGQLGCTPDTIDDEINIRTEKILALKNKMETMLPEV